jgi:hypothetical protein
VLATDLVLPEVDLIELLPPDVDVIESLPPEVDVIELLLPEVLDERVDVPFRVVV